MLTVIGHFLWWMGCWFLTSPVFGGLKTQRGICSHISCRDFGSFATSFHAPPPYHGVLSLDWKGCGMCTNVRLCHFQLTLVLWEWLRRPPSLKSLRKYDPEYRVVQHSTLHRLACESDRQRGAEPREPQSLRTHVRLLPILDSWFSHDKLGI